MARILTCFIAAFVLSGCSILVNGSTDDVALNTPGIEEAECHIWTPKHRYRMLTPGVVRVERSQYDLEYTCVKEGYVNASGKIPATLDQTLYANVLNGVGFLVDGYEGTAFMYPEKVTINMQPVNGAQK